MKYLLIVLIILLIGCAPAVNIVSNDSEGPVEYVKGKDGQTYMFFQKYESSFNPFRIVGQNWIKLSECPNFSDDFHITFEDIDRDTKNLILIVMETKTESYGKVYVVMAYTYTRDGIDWTYALDGTKEMYVRVAGDKQDLI